MVRDEERGLEVSVTVTKAWASGANTFYQMDIVMTNTGSAALSDVVISWPASCQDQVQRATVGVRNVACFLLYTTKQYQTYIVIFL
jgi:hypothetical protein